MSPPDSMSHENGESESNRREVKVVESLGEALAGVSIGGGNNSTSSFGVGSSAIASTGTPFAIAPGTLRDSNNTSTDGWGSFVTLTSEGDQNAAASADIGTSTTSVDNSSHVRNESLELFLSQSPSQTLGEDVFKFSHTNLPALAEEEVHNGLAGNSLSQAAPAGFGERHRSYQENNARRRNDSPTCSATGTTTSSRSVSPYGNGDSSSTRTIQAFQGHRIDTVAPVSTSAPFVESFVPNQHQSQSSRALGSLDLSQGAQYSRDRSHPFRSKSSGGSQYDEYGNYESRFQGNGMKNQTLDAVQHQFPVVGNNGSLPASGQVLYMTMPSPDGRGQVLQPVQMMQLPGKPYTYVIPGNGAMNSLQGGAALQSQSVTMLPPLQGSNNSILEYGNVMRNNRAVSDTIHSNYSIDNYDVQASSYGDLGGADNVDYMKGSVDGAQFSTDPALASLYASPQRPPLETLLGQIRRLSRDQVGCRLVQQALDEEGAMGATLILQEGLPFWGEAMVDPFGNYLFQKVLEKVSPQERVLLIKSVSTRLVNASLNLHGTRSVQKVVELCAQDEQEGFNIGVEESASCLLTKALAPSAARLCIDSHGNHVIQRILLRLGPVHSQFVFDAVAASVGDVARHRHGCCVIQRCLDSPQSDARAHLVRRIVQKSLELMQDAYGNYVVQYVLDVCSDDDVHAVCDSVVGKVNLLAIQKFSSNVMEKCLERCTDRTKEMYLAEMSDPERVRELMMDPFGNYVIQRALSVATHAQAIRLVEAMRPHLMAVPMTGPNGARNGGVRNTAGGRRIIAKICRRFPNFTLNPVGSQEELYSQNKGNHRYLNHHQQTGLLQPHLQQQQQPHQSILAAYAPIGAPLQYYTPPDTSIAQMSPMTNQSQQQQFQYGLGNGATGYYNPFGDTHGGYPGM